MSDTARSYQPDQPATTEGLDDLFIGTELGSVIENEAKELGTEPSSVSAVEVVTTDEAARRLGISTRAVIKRLKSGSLKGYRDDSKARAEWRIYWNSEGSEPAGSGSSCGTAGSFGAEPGSIGEQSKPTKDSELQDTYLIELNKKLLEQVQALTYRNGYLESQLSEREKDVLERDAQVKLLTDNQSKQGWWANFSAWFLGLR